MNVFGARRSAKNFRLWQDKEAIAAGTLWEGEIKTASGQSVFFIPIITPTVVKSPYCQFELNSFLAREADLGRSDLVFPILYITVPALNDADQVQADPVLSIIAKRQYVDWRDLRHHDANSREVKQAVERFCAQVSDALRRRWLTPEERKAQDEATALQKAEAGRKRGEEEAKRREEEARRKAAQEQALKPGDTFQECSQCPKMMVVPAGRFTMGSPVSEPGRYSDEGPQHTVAIAKQFAVGQYELTFADWDACVAGGGCNGYTPTDQGWGRGRRPVINVSWDDASAYVAWLSKKTGKPYRLLSESEYEYAARAGTATAYPWGDAIGTNNANCNGCGSQWDGKETAPVGSFAANGFGLYDMVGNVWEWTEDCYHDSYHGAPTDGSAWTRGGDCSSRFLRGGSWINTPDGLRSAIRAGVATGSRINSLGFRVGRTLLTP